MADVEERPVASQVTVRDVAKVAGVSPMTVSRVLNGQKWVAAATQARVREAIAKTGFRPNRTARNLRQGRTYAMVGLAVRNIANPFFATINGVVEEIARAHGALLVVASWGREPTGERELVEALFTRGLDGLLLYPTRGDHGYLQRDQLAGWPVVFMGRPPGGIVGDTVAVDHAGGGEQAVMHLVAHGHRRIGLVGYDDPLSDLAGEPAGAPGGDPKASRVAGYRRALTIAGIPYDPAIVRLDCADATAATAATRDLLALSDAPTALVAMNNRMTVGVLHALGSGLGGVALVGFDDLELADLFTPPITVVTQDPATLGRRAAEVLLARLDGSSSPRVQDMLPMRLIVRGSGELPPR